MTEAKIEVTLGAISFSGEGEQEWLGQQLDKILEAAPGLANIQLEHVETPSPGAETVRQEGEFKETLVSHIKAKGGERNQVKRFLATANWLKLRGETQLTTAKVASALSENQQKRLANPADCLNKNVAKGYCEKTKDNGFFITPDGLKELGNAA
ncbi:MAG: hypothetical protein ABID84_05630 [Chloroflexota bacterium]